MLPHHACCAAQEHLGCLVRQNRGQEAVWQAPLLASGIPAEICGDAQALSPEPQVRHGSRAIRCHATCPARVLRDLPIAGNQTWPQRRRTTAARRPRSRDGHDSRPPVSRLQYHARHCPRQHHPVRGCRRLPTSAWQHSQAASPALSLRRARLLAALRRAVEPTDRPPPIPSCAPTRARWKSGQVRSGLKSGQVAREEGRS